MSGITNNNVNSDASVVVQAHQASEGTASAVLNNKPIEVLTTASLTTAVATGSATGTATPAKTKPEFQSATKVAVKNFNVLGNAAHNGMKPGMLRTAAKVLAFAGDFIRYIIAVPLALIRDLLVGVASRFERWEGSLSPKLASAIQSQEKKADPVDTSKAAPSTAPVSSASKAPVEHADPMEGTALNRLENYVSGKYASLKAKVSQLFTREKTAPKTADASVTDVGAEVIVTPATVQEKAVKKVKGALAEIAQKVSTEPKVNIEQVRDLKKASLTKSAELLVQAYQDEYKVPAGIEGSYVAIDTQTRLVEGIVRELNDCAASTDHVSNSSHLFELVNAVYSGLIDGKSRHAITDRNNIEANKKNPKIRDAAFVRIMDDVKLQPFADRLANLVKEEFTAEMITGSVTGAVDKLNTKLKTATDRRIISDEWAQEIRTGLHDNAVKGVQAIFARKLTANPADALDTADKVLGDLIDKKIINSAQAETIYGSLEVEHLKHMANLRAVYLQTVDEEYKQALVAGNPVGDVNSNAQTKLAATPVTGDAEDVQAEIYAKIAGLVPAFADRLRNDLLKALQAGTDPVTAATILNTEAQKALKGLFKDALPKEIFGKVQTGEVEAALTASVFKAWERNQGSTVNIIVDALIQNNVLKAERKAAVIQAVQAQIDAYRANTKLFEIFSEKHVALNGGLDLINGMFDEHTALKTALADKKAVKENLFSGKVSVGSRSYTMMELLELYNQESSKILADGGLNSRQKSYQLNLLKTEKFKDFMPMITQMNSIVTEMSDILNKQVELQGEIQTALTESEAGFGDYMSWRQGVIDRMSDTRRTAIAGAESIIGKRLADLKSEYKVVFKEAFVAVPLATAVSPSEGSDSDTEDAEETTTNVHGTNGPAVGGDMEMPPAKPSLFSNPFRWGYTKVFG